MVNYNKSCAVAQKPKYGIVRVSMVQVRAPYDAREIAVLRPDGSMAFDPYNKFPAIPSQIIRGAAIDALASSGLFASAVSASSSVSSDVSAEVSVLKFALDCRNEGSRKAIAAVAVRIVDRDRRSAAIAEGVGEADASSGEYSSAFSSAFTSAMADALGAL